MALEGKKNYYEILNAEKLFYSKLYTKQSVNRLSDETNSFLTNPNILRLLEELSTAYEGEITFQECENILDSFQAGKMLGNDGFQ